MAVQTALALAQATGSLRPLLLASGALLSPSAPEAPPSLSLHAQAHAAAGAEGAASATASAPGMGYHLAKVYAGLKADLAALIRQGRDRPDVGWPSSLPELEDDLVSWRGAIGLPPPPSLSAPVPSSGRRLSRSSSAPIAPPELTPELTPTGASAALLAAIAAYASPMEAVLLGAEGSGDEGRSERRSGDEGRSERRSGRPTLRPLASVEALVEQLRSLKEVR